MNLTETPPPERLQTVTYPPGWRLVAATLFLLSRLSPFVIALMFFLGWVISPPLLVRLVLFLMLIPGLMLWLLQRIFAVDGQYPAPLRLADASLPYARAKAQSRLARWHWPWFKFGVFGLFPVLVVFRLHQNVMYGGLLGQYYLHGLAPWLSSLAYYWIVYTIYLVLFAAFWRGWVELGCWAGARFLPARAGTFRRWGEALALVVYFIGIPAFIVWRSVV
ncbi:MAG: hypothetical protein ACXIUB_06690 [Wenzhouxiangella sp.]